MTRALPGLVLVLSLSGCVLYTSSDPEHDPQYVTSHGVTLTATLTSGRSLTGELLSADTAGILLLRDDGRPTVEMLRFGIVRSLCCADATLSPSAGVPAERLAELRSRARFPFGITPAAIAAMLREVDRAAIDTVRLAASR